MGFTIAIHSLLKALEDYIFTYLLRAIFGKRSSQTRSDYGSNVRSTLSPSLVPLPLHLIKKAIKDHLPIDHFSKIKLQSQAYNNIKGEDDDDDACCVVCLNSIEALHKVRKLGNCEHVFHAECIDAWIDEGWDTCPVCRARVSPGFGEDVRQGKDFWRSERMIYLFGEDFIMGN